MSKMRNDIVAQNESIGVLQEKIRSNDDQLVTLNRNLTDSENKLKDLRGKLKSSSSEIGKVERKVLVPTRKKRQSGEGLSETTMKRRRGKHGKPV